MNQETLYRKMADYIRKNGFTPDYCDCFIHAADQVFCHRQLGALFELQEIVGGTFSSTGLQSNGWSWDKSSSDDAAAACEIAADLAARRK